MEKKEKVNKKTIKIWRHHLQDEVDATFLYSVFAELETDYNRKEILSDLSEVESKHVDRWEKMLSTYNIKFKHIKPSLKAQFWSWYARNIDKVLPLARMLKEEASEVKEYIALHKSSTHSDAKETALILAKESAQHTESLNELTGTTDEPWHKTESGGVLGNIIYGFNDGLTANFGLVAGVIAASESVNTILVAGIVGTVADSLSMGASGYLAAKSEQEVYDHEIQVEKDEIRLMPDIEEEELALIYAARGVPKEHAQELAKEVMSDPERALEEKIQAELKIVRSIQHHSVKDGSQDLRLRLVRMARCMPAASGSIDPRVLSRTYTKRHLPKFGTLGRLIRFFRNLILLKNAPGAS